MELFPSYGEQTPVVCLSEAREQQAEGALWDNKEWVCLCISGEQPSSTPCIRNEVDSFLNKGIGFYISAPSSLKSAVS